jgi:hypothetical protein
VRSVVILKAVEDEMEKKYIFYRTGLGLLVFSVGCIVLMALCVFLVVSCPELGWIHYLIPAVVALFIIVFSFWVDEHFSNRLKGIH